MESALIGADHPLPPPAKHHLIGAHPRHLLLKPLQHLELGLVDPFWLLLDGGRHLLRTPAALPDFFKHLPRFEIEFLANLLAGTAIDVRVEGLDPNAIDFV